MMALLLKGLSMSNSGKIDGVVGEGLSASNSGNNNEGLVVDWLSRCCNCNNDVMMAC